MRWWMGGVVEADEGLVEAVQGKSWIILSKHPFPFSSDQRLDNLLPHSH